MFRNDNHEATAAGGVDVIVKPVLNWANICFANIIRVFVDLEKKFGEYSWFLIERTFASRI